MLSCQTPEGVDARQLALNTMVFARERGWPQAFLVSNDLVPSTGRCDNVPRPPCWIVRDSHAFVGIQLFPRSYSALQVHPDGSITANTQEAQQMLDIVAGQPWIGRPPEADLVPA